MVLPKWVSSLTNRLQFQDKDPECDRYEECPLCRHGALSTLIMMDAMSCDFCRHIFSIDITQPMVQGPILRIEDSAHPLTWQWNGDRWMALPQAEQSLILWLWILCASIVVVPSTLMSLAIYLFPATPNSHGAWFGTVWLGLTIFSHLMAATWLLAEHYQWPLYHRAKLVIRQRFSNP